VKRWLEATMRFNVLYTAYEAQNRLTLPLLGAGVKRYDLYAQHFEASPRQYSGRDVYVEVKTIDTEASARGLSADFARFVAHSYSATMKDLAERGVDPKWEFMFTTTHPWLVNGFLELTTPGFVKAACERTPDALGGAAIDAEWVAIVASRLWIWIIPRRQDEMSMGDQLSKFLLDFAAGQRL
jgi:hypothetical protein